MLRLGHIDYANCFPVHARLLDDETPAGVRLRTGVPSELNRALGDGSIDIAPASSIEYARHADAYRLLPGLAIASDGPVRSILLETSVPVHALDSAAVALPTASATSVVLLRILLEQRYGVRPSYRWFDQRGPATPFDTGAAAALWIGDDALRRAAASRRRLLDLGAEWKAWTGLPFVFALWQTGLRPERDAEIARLQTALLESLAHFEAKAAELAGRHAGRFGMGERPLLDYWRSLEYRLGAREQDGLLRFYEYAAGIGEIDRVPALRWVEPAPAA